MKSEFKKVSKKLWFQVLLDIIEYDTPFMRDQYSVFWIRVDLDSGQFQQQRNIFVLPFLSMVRYTTGIRWPEVASF
jgi:hypothetical protein